MFQPKNEQGVIALFCMSVNDSPWSLVSIGTNYPDAVIQMGNEVWEVEFEYMASNFVSHGHDPRKCDMIVCWENDYPDCPLPIMALSQIEAISIGYEKSSAHRKEAEYWKLRALKAERKLSAAMGQEPDTEPEPVIKKMSMDDLGEFVSGKVFEALCLISENPEMQQKDIAPLAGISPSTVSRCLRPLKDCGLLEHDGNEWKLHPQLVAQLNGKLA